MFYHHISVTVGQGDTSVVDAVMKRFPPPPGPDDQEPGLSSSRTFESNRPHKSCRFTDQPSLNTPRPTTPNSTAGISDTPLIPGLVIGHAVIHTLIWNGTHFAFV